MKHAFFLAVSLSLGAAVAYTETTLPAGQVACVNLRSAKNYAAYQTTAPAFAANLLARAACYVVKNPATAVAYGGPEAGFQAYTLLSGHKVWLPAPTR